VGFYKFGWFRFKILIVRNITKLNNNERNELIKNTKYLNLIKYYITSILHVHCYGNTFEKYRIHISCEKKRNKNEDNLVSNVNCN
jgi:hypothetical protein